MATDGEHQTFPRSVIPARMIGAVFTSQSIFHTNGALGVDGCSCFNKHQQHTIAESRIRVDRQNDFVIAERLAVSKGFSTQPCCTLTSTHHANIMAESAYHALRAVP